MKKRMLALVLVLALTASLMPAAFADAGFENFKKVQTYTAGQFTDVKTTDWFAENVATAYEYGLMYGDSASTFNPNGNLTVAESIALVCRLHKTYCGDTTAIPDSDPWYQASVDYAANAGIIKIGNYTSYNANISRAEFVMLINAALPGEAFAAVRKYADGSIPDVPAKASYRDTVYKFYNAGILSGSDEKGSFNPHSFIRRSEASTVILLTALPDMRATAKPAEPPAASDFKVGDVVEIKAGTKNVYPGSNPIQDWYFNYYYTISAVDEGGKPVVKGGVNCVQLGIQILKKDGPTGPSAGDMGTWVDPSILTLVKAASEKPDTPAVTVKYGDIVEIKADATTLFPNGAKIDDLLRKFYFKVTALTDELNYPVMRGNIQCVKLGVMIFKESGVDGAEFSTCEYWVDPAILNVVKESTEVDPGPKPLDPSVLKIGDIVKINDDVTVFYPGGATIDPTTKANHYFVVGQLVNAKGQPLIYGEKECVLLTDQIKKTDGPDGKPVGKINSMIAKESISLVKRQPWNDPTQYTVYVVKATDTSFWQIAVDQLGNGELYTEIFKYNNFTESTSLKAGMMIKLPLKK